MRNQRTERNQRWRLAGTVLSAALLAGCVSSPLAAQRNLTVAEAGSGGGAAATHYRTLAAEMAAKAEQAEKVMAGLERGGGKTYQNVAPAQELRIQHYRAKQKEYERLAEIHEAGTAQARN